tara:strand:- start:9540 stop:10313 length:774 start_codon:yes stop_codon:yes gene_type:complete
MNQLLDKDNIYISKSIRNYVLKLDESNPTYYLSNLKFQIYYYSLKPTKKKEEKLKEVYERIEKMYKEYKIKKLEFIIIDYDGDRYISNKMKSHYINGGFTIIMGNRIYIFRRKEYPKVILHEMFHHIYNPFEQNCYYINLNKKYGENILVSEAITEFLATIQHLKYLKGDFKELLEEEIKHSEELSRYILDIKEDNTNIKSYILLKYILLKNYEESIKNIRNPCKIYKILEEFDMSLLKKKKIKGKMRIRFMKNSDY